MRLLSLLCLLSSGFLWLSCADTQPKPGPSAGSGGGPAWRAVNIEDEPVAGDAGAPPVTDVELDRMLDALEQQIEHK